MIQVEPIQAFNGFGSGKTQLTAAYTQAGSPGEHFYSHGMQRSQFGIAPKLSIATAVTNADLGNLQLINWFSQGQFSGNKYVYGFGENGRLYKASAGNTVWTEERTVGISSHGNGMIFDQTNRLLYANDQYLGKTTDGSTFTDNWKDFTITTTDLRPMDTYEDWVVIGNQYQIALLNVTDDSFNANALNLPTGFNIRCIKSGKNGILIGANFNNRGALILWDAFSIRSIAPWIWRTRNIQSITPTDDGWIVITQNEIFLTDGYSVQPILPDFPDYLQNDLSIINDILPQGAEVQGNNLLFLGRSNRYNRQKAGLYRLNLTTKLLDFIPIPNGVTFNAFGGAIFSDNGNFTHLSFKSTLPDTKLIGVLSNSPIAHPYLISEPLGQTDNEKVAEGVKLTFGVSSYQPTTTDITFDVLVKVCNARRNIFGRGQTRAVSTSADVLKIDGSIAEANGMNKAQVGDEVTILEGINAGQVRHILSIANQGTNTETWTLDSVLPNMTETLVNMNVSPFKLAKKFTLSNVSELIELFFDVQNRIKGKKFFVKILLENLPAGFMPELKGGQFIFDDLGIKR